LKDAVVPSRSDRSEKVIVFFPTARLTQFYAELFENIGLELCEVHSGKTSRHCEDALEQFHAQGRAVLFTTDTTHCGADFPEVKLVIQVGLTAGPSQYRRRVCHASVGGSCVTLLCDYEVQSFLERDFMMLSSGSISSSMQVRDLAGESAVERARAPLSRALKHMDARIKEAAYASWLACHKNSMLRLGWDEKVLVRRAWQWCRAVAGMDRPPILPLRVVEDIGLVGVPGVEINYGPDPEEVRKNPERIPDMHGKFKKRKPMPRFYYASRHLASSRAQKPRPSPPKRKAE
jgi:ATP-dependent RNA helicase MSS116